MWTIGWCGDLSQPPKEIAMMSWGPKVEWRACDQMCQSLAEGCSHYQIRLLEKGATCGRTVSWWIQVPSPEQISAMVRACLARWQWFMEDSSQSEKFLVQTKIVKQYSKVCRTLCSCPPPKGGPWQPTFRQISRHPQVNHPWACTSNPRYWTVNGCAILLSTTKC